MQKRILAIMIGSTLALAACQPGEPLPGDEDGAPEPASAVSAAQDDLADILGIDAQDIAVVDVTAETWPDACLGLAESEEICAQVLTPGYRVSLEARGLPYAYRTDEVGDNVRREPAGVEDDGDPTGTGSDTGGLDEEEAEFDAF